MATQSLIVSESKGFFGSLFDFSFTSLVTTKLISLLYAIIVILETLVAVIALLAGLSHGALVGIGVLVLTVVGYIAALIYARVICELLIVLFRIHENLVEMVKLERLGARARPASPMEAAVE